MRKLLPVLVTFVFVSSYSFAASNIPVVVEAQKLTYSDKEKVATYVGNVIAQHGETVITGDELTIFFDPTGKHIKKILVEGNVHIKDPRGEGWCKKLIYYPFEEKVVLIGDAKLKQKDNLIIGDRIVAYRDGRVNVEGVKQRVKTVIYPEESSVGRSKRP